MRIFQFFSCPFARASELGVGSVGGLLGFGLVLALQGVWICGPAPMQTLSARTSIPDVPSSWTMPQILAALQIVDRVGHVRTDHCYAMACSTGRLAATLKLPRPGGAQLRLGGTSGQRPESAGPTSCLISEAEDARFELARGCPQHAFQACALGH